jgi:PAS domain S-box-containing protein
MRKELRDFTENAACAMHGFDADGRILWANQAELEMLGYAREEYVGRRIADFHVDQSVAADLVARLSRHETIREVEARLRCKDGTVRHVLIDGNVVARDGEPVQTCCFTRDISALRLVSRERELFLGMLGHDLRNPLGAIVASAGTLSMHDGLDERARRMVARIGNSSSRMARLVEQILDFASVRAGGGIPVVRRPVDIAAVCDEVIDELRTAHPDRRIEARCLGDGSGVWDPDRLSQVFSNLVGNALAHGDPHEPIRVLVTQQNGQVMVRVHNMGPPIPADTIPTLFDPFRRARDSKRTAVPGLGLGLYITREIVRAHGGTIDVRSSRDAGTTFCVRLPRHDSVVRVLVVDDDGDTADVRKRPTTAA